MFFLQNNMVEWAANCIHLGISHVFSRPLYSRVKCLPSKPKCRTWHDDRVQWISFKKICLLSRYTQHDDYVSSSRGTIIVCQLFSSLSFSSWELLSSHAQNVQKIHIYLCLKTTQFNEKWTRIFICVLQSSKSTRSCPVLWTVHIYIFFRETLVH